MKFIHTADWHLGKLVHDFSMIEDQQFYFDKFLELTKQKNVDAVVMAGDLYDRSVPPAAAVELCDYILTSLVLEQNTPVIAISGNHDSSERVGFASKLLRDKGLFLSSKISKTIDKVTLQDEHGPVHFYMIPYCDPSLIRKLYNDDSITDHHEAMRVIVEGIKEEWNIEERNVAIAHGYFTYSRLDKENRGGLEVSDSERPLSIGGTDLIDANLFNDFDYVALGHLHGSQKVGDDHIRYSGSPLKYSVSESNHNKSITYVTLGKKGDVSIEVESIKPLRDVRVVKGTLEEIVSDNNNYSDDFVFVELSDKGEVLDAISKLRAIFPNILGLKRVYNKKNTESKTSANGNFRERHMSSLFEDFYESLFEEELDEDQKKVIVDIIETVGRDEA